MNDIKRLPEKFKVLEVVEEGGTLLVLKVLASSLVDHQPDYSRIDLTYPKDKVDALIEAIQNLYPDSESQYHKRIGKAISALQDKK